MEVPYIRNKILKSPFSPRYFCPDHKMLFFLWNTFVQKNQTTHFSCTFQIWGQNQEKNLAKKAKNRIFAKILGSNIGQKHRFLTACQNGYFILAQKWISKILKANFLSFSGVKILNLGTFEIAAKNGPQNTIFSTFDDFRSKITIWRPFLAAISKVLKSKILTPEKLKK